MTRRNWNIWLAILNKLHLWAIESGKVCWASVQTPVLCWCKLVENTIVWTLGEEGKQNVTIQLEKSFSVFYLHIRTCLGNMIARPAGSFKRCIPRSRQQNIAEESPSFFSLRKKTAHFCMHSASPLRVPSLTLFCAPKSSFSFSQDVFIEIDCHHWSPGRPLDSGLLRPWDMSAMPLSPYKDRRGRGRHRGWRALILTQMFSVRRLGNHWSSAAEGEK